MFEMSDISILIPPTGASAGTHQDSYFIRNLTADDLDESFALFSKVANDLHSKGKGHLLKPVTMQNLQRDLELGHHILGFYKNGVLIAQLILDRLENPESTVSVNGWPQKAFATAHGRVRSVCIDPDEKGGCLPSGQKYVEALFDASTQTARDIGLVKLFAKIANENLSSQSHFQRQGYSPVFSGIDASGPKPYRYQIWGLNLSTAPIDLPLPVGQAGSYERFEPIYVA
jgi:hypothetical protein